MTTLLCGTPGLSFSLNCCRVKPPTSPNYFFFNPPNVSSPDVPPRVFSSRRITTNFGAVLSPKTWASPQPIFACMKNDEAELPSDSQPDNKSLTEATIDLKLPRRSLSVQFTCNSCGERTKRLVNRLAYERGTVFVQCAECLQHHKLVDNLNLVVEYDLRKDEKTDLNVDQD